MDVSSLAQIVGGGMPFSETQASLVRLKQISAEQRRPLAFWVGAGLSRDAGMPTWPSLRDQLASEALEKLNTLEPQEAKLREAELTDARSNLSLWDAFTTLKSILGDASYREAIRSRFEYAPTVDIPEVYKSIWSLDSVTGILNLNIDGLATRAQRRIRPEEDILTFQARDAPDYVHLVSQRKPFIANLHGVHEAHSSWVFTRGEIQRLLSTPAYISFINFVFSSMSVVFIGISADDVAAGGILENLTQMGMDVGPHFWITDRRDAKTDAWANSAGLLPIRYEPEGGKNHTSVLLSMLESIKAYKSFDQKAPVIVAPGEVVASLPSVQDLRLLEDDDLRSRLTSYAKRLIENGGNSTSSAEYVSFLEAYSPSIHQAFHVTNVRPFNRFFSYEVMERVSNGPFSSVWRVRDEKGDSAALKIIQTDSLKDGPQLESFRRGVQSLNFLSESGMLGTARLREAHEIPTAVIMDFIEGDDLTEIVHHSSYKFWSNGISLGINLCAHIDSAHNLPAGVLHRDIRPSNIMMPYFYWGESAEDAGHSANDVVVLNYDMSWHKDAQGRTISGNIQEAGYYAPEQLDNREGELARSTKVDSYGIGMTLFFAATKSNPPIGGSRDESWPEKIKQIRLDYSIAWKSSASRLRRIIAAATNVNPAGRPTVSEIRAQLISIRDAIEDRWDNIAPDAWAEEIFCRAIGNDYNASASGTEFTKELRAGRLVTLQGNLSANSVRIAFRNQAMDGTDWSSIDKHWSKKLESARDIFASNGWNISDDTRYSLHEIHLIAEIPVSVVRSRFAATVEGLQRGLNMVRLD